MNIGVFGGSFDPPHIGHLHAAKSFINEAKLEILYIIPTHISPFKKDKTDVGCDKDRLEMCKLSFSELESEKVCVIISDIEIKRSGTSYTIDTINEILEQHKDDNIFLYVGTDTFLTLEKWFKFQELLEKCTIYTHVRSNCELPELNQYAEFLNEKYFARVIISQDAAIICSSTQVRENIRKNNVANTKKMLTESVFRYIIKNSLYKREDNE